MEILVCGSRGWKDVGKVCYELASIAESLTVGTLIVIHGECKDSPDEIASRWCKGIEDVEEKPYPARWDLYDKAAGSIRNRQMLKENNVDLVLAFWNGTSRGTRDMIKQATIFGVPEIRISPERSR